MKKYQLRFIAALTAAASLGVGCGPKGNDGGGGGGGDLTAQRNQWIYDELSEWYLWPDDVKAKTPNLATADYEAFFNSLLSTNREDGYLSGNTHYFYSFIERSGAATRGMVTSDKSFGFEFEPAFYGTNYNNMVYVISYVVPGSPAYKAGLRRGYNILEVGGTMITTYNHNSLYPLLLPEEYTGRPLQPVTVRGVYFADPDDPANSNAAFSETLTPARVIDSAVHYSRTIEVEGGKAGYMLYNAFESGYPNIFNSDFNDHMKKVFAGFKAEGVTDLVIDLRYNGGGLNNSTELMIAMVNNSHKGQTYVTDIYNDYINNKYHNGRGESVPLPSLDELKNTWTQYDGQLVSRYGTGPATDLALDRVFVLTSEDTASASEMVIIGLRGLGVEVVQIGTLTHGKGVGMSSIYQGGKFGGYSYTMWPVTCFFVNALGDRVPVGGLVPDVEVDPFNGGLFFPWGDERDPLLGAALDYIEGTVTRTAVTRSAASGPNMIKADMPASYEFRPGRGMRRITDVQEP